VWDALALPARWRYRHIPGPAFRPLVGNLPDFIKYGSHEFWRQCAQEYGPVFKVRSQQPVSGGPRLLLAGQHYCL
jgi:hypothetical protein